MAAAQPATFEVVDAMALCGVDNVVQFNGATAAGRIATEIFDDDHQSVMDKSYTELQEDLKAFSSLTVANGQIRLMPGTTRNIRAYIQWARDLIRVGDDPNAGVFDVNNARDLVRKYKTHETFVNKSKNMSDTSKPPQFTAATKWDEWSPVFINFLRTIPGRNGQPLSYICRKNDAPEAVPGADFMDDYVNRAPLNGDAFNIDAAEVHTYLQSFINGNETAEAKILGHADQNNGRLDFIALREHYEGVGANSRDLLAADKILDTLHYTGERQPHMWWEEFEKQLTKAFTIYERHEGRTVYSDLHKLRTLIRKVDADFLMQVKSSINIELTRDPVTMTFDRALTTFRNEVNLKFPPQVGNTRRTRRINEMESMYDIYGDYGSGYYGGRGRGRGGRGRGRRGRGNGRGGGYNTRSVQLSNGSRIDVHPAFHFSPEVWDMMPVGERDRIRDERNAHRRRRLNNGGYDREGGNDNRSTISEITQNDGDGTRVNDQRTAGEVQRENSGSQTSGTIMGGRNEQASQRNISRE